MKPLRHSFVPAAGQRTPQTLLAIDERDRYLCEAAKFCVDMTDHEAADHLRAKLSQYRSCAAWRRERAENSCPTRHRNRLTECLWLILKTIDAIPGDKTVRNALALGRERADRGR